MILSIRNNLFKEDIIMLKKNGVIVLQGDSITDAGRFGDEEHLGSGYPRMVAKYIENSYPDYSIKVYNKGISGNRSKDLVARWKEDTLDLNPTVVTILIGINDTWRAFDSNDPTSAEEYAANCEKIMKWTKEAGAALIILEPFAVPTGTVKDEWRADIDPKIHALRKLSLKYADEYVPLDGIFYNLSVAASPEVWTGDGVHPSAAGHRVIAKEIINILER